MKYNILNKISKSRFSWKERIKMEISERILTFVSSLPRFQRGLFSEIQNRAEFRRKDVTETTIPAGTKLELLSVWLFDVFYVEDINLLKKGLIELISDFPSRRFLLHTSASKVEESFDTIQRSFFGRSWSNIGAVDIGSTLKKLQRRNWIDYLHFEIYRFSPSFVGVSIMVQPAKEYTDILNDVFTREVLERVCFHLPPFRWLFKSWGSSWVSRATVKQEQVEDLILEFKEEVRKLVSHYFEGILFKRRGAVPGVLLFWFEEEAGMKQKNRTNFFWEAIGLEKEFFLPFRNETEGVFFFEPENRFWRKWVLDASYRILVDKTKLQLQSGFDSLGAQIKHRTNYWVKGLLPIVIYQEMIKDSYDNLNSFREAFYKKIRKKFGLSIIRDSVRTLFQLKQQLNERYVTLQRLHSEFSKEDFLRHTNDEIPELTRELQFSKSKAAKSDYRVDVVTNIEFWLNLVNKYYKLINSQFSELLQERVSHSNLRIQRAVMWLTGAVIFLSLLPEKTKNWVFEIILQFFFTLFQKVVVFFK